jgi:DNA-binding MarR family transcriptional regulator
LSPALVAFTIEFDNESEHRIPHLTANWGLSPGAGPGAPWLISQGLWVNVLRYVGADGVRVSELHRRSRTTLSQLHGLQRWRYLRVSDERDPLLRPTSKCRAAQEIWRPLAGEIEARWRDRFGSDSVAALRASLGAIIDQLDVDLPDYLPITSPTQNSKLATPAPRRRLADTSELDVSVLLAQVLMAFTLDFEAVSRLSLPIAANTVRVLDSTGVRIRDLPALTGVSKEAHAMAYGLLRRRQCVVIEPDPNASRGQVLRLTERGERSQANYLRNLSETEAAWRTRFGEVAIDGLRSALARIVGDQPTAEASPLFEGLRPYPDGWRAKVRKPTTLPHYPMVLHRGAYPDGA